MLLIAFVICTLSSFLVEPAPCDNRTVLMNDTFLDWTWEGQVFEGVGQCYHDFYIPKGYFLVTNMEMAGWNNGSGYEFCNYFQENDSEESVWQQVAIPPPTFSLVLKVRVDSVPNIVNYEIRLVPMQAFRKNVLLPMDEAADLYIYQVAEMWEGYTYIFRVEDSQQVLSIVPYSNTTKSKELSNVFLYNGYNSSSALMGTLLMLVDGEEYRSSALSLYIAKKVLLSPVALVVQYMQKKNTAKPCVIYPTASSLTLSPSQSTCTILSDRTDDGLRYTGLTLTLNSLVGESVAVFDGYPNEKWSTSPLLVFGNTSLPGEPPNPRYLSGRARTLYLNGESAEFLVSNAGEEEEIVSSDGGTGTLFNSYIGPGELEKWRMVRLAGGNETAGGGLYRYEFTWIRNGTALVETKNSIERQERSYYTWANLGELAKKEISK